MPYPKGKPQSEESKRLRRETMLRRIAEDPTGWAQKAKQAGQAGTTPEAQMKRRAAMKANGTDRVSVVAMSAAMARPDVRAKLSAERKARYANDPEWRERMQKTCIAAAHTPEVNERRRQAARAYAESPEGREAKRRGGDAALHAHRGASARKEWEYRGHRFRSSWERAFAVWLDGLGVLWWYESRRFKLPDGRYYTPDFLVSPPGAEAVWVEIKGHRDDEKFQVFHEMVPRSVLLRQEHLEGVLS